MQVSRTSWTSIISHGNYEASQLFCANTVIPMVSFRLKVPQAIAMHIVVYAAALEVLRMPT